MSWGAGDVALTSHKDVSRLAFLRRALTGNDFGGDCEGRVPSPYYHTPISRAERRRNPRDESNFRFKCRSALRVDPQSSDLSRPRKLFSCKLVKRIAKDPLRDRLVLSAEEFFSFSSSASSVDYPSKPELSLTWRLVRNRLSLIRGLTDLPDCERCATPSNIVLGSAPYVIMSVC